MSTASSAERRSLDERVWSDLTRRTPTFWINGGAARGAAPSSLGLSDVMQADARWRRFAPVLAALFPQQLSDGIIESELKAIPRLSSRWLAKSAPAGAAARVLLKADHDLPVAGSVKARGGIYEVLCAAERAALAEGLLAGEDDDYTKLLSPKARRLFGASPLLVASTGNLGFAVGVIGRALGFATTVHMSQDAKAWKKDRLRALGAQVVEHAADYTSAVAAARESAAGNARAHFVDDERSLDLFLGYSTAALRLVEQLRDRGVEIDERNPLCLYLPCGVGGAPGGILFGLRALLGERALGFFAEPTAAPCMLMRLLGRLAADASVYDIGLDNDTVADGLAVARASELVAELVGPHLAGAYTVSDEEMLRWVSRAHSEEGLRLEPAAAVGFPGALQRVWESAALESHRETMARATHVIWATGGSLVPDEQFRALLARCATGEK